MVCEHIFRCCNRNFVQNVKRIVRSCGRSSTFCDAGLVQRSNFSSFTFARNEVLLHLSEKMDIPGLSELFYSRGFSNVFNILHKTCQWSVIRVPHRGMAGHSKWQNIKHIKQAKDAARANTFSKLARQIKVAVQLGKSTDPRFNNQLAHLVEVARQANMPNSKIESLIKGSENSKEVMMPFTMEAMGPGGCFIIIEVLTDNINRARNNLKYELSKVGTTIVDGSVKHAFKHKGVVHVDPAASSLTLEDAVDIAIDVGAEDVVNATDDDDGESVLQFQCEPREFYSVKTALSSKGYAVRSSGLCYLPHLKVALNDDQLNLMSRLCEVLEEHPDVVKFYDNVE